MTTSTPSTPVSTAILASIGVRKRSIVISRICKGPTIHMTPHVGQDLSLESELADGLAIFAGLL